MRIIFLTLITIFISISVAGCGNADMKGIVLEVNENGIKLAENVSPSEYEEIENESVIKLQNEDVEGKRASLGLIDLTYDNNDEFSKGDEVEVWIDGDVWGSYPSGAKAKKISKIK